MNYNTLPTFFPYMLADSEGRYYRIHVPTKEIDSRRGDHDALNILFRSVLEKNYGISTRGSILKVIIEGEDDVILEPLALQSSRILQEPREFNLDIEDKEDFKKERVEEIPFGLHTDESYPNLEESFDDKFATTNNTKTKKIYRTKKDLLKKHDIFKSYVHDKFATTLINIIQGYPCDNQKIMTRVLYRLFGQSIKGINPNEFNTKIAEKINNKFNFEISNDVRGESIITLSFTMNLAVSQFYKPRPTDAIPYPTTIGEQIKQLQHILHQCYKSLLENCEGLGEWLASGNHNDCIVIKLVDLHGKEIIGAGITIFAGELASHGKKHCYRGAVFNTLKRKVENGFYTQEKYQKIKRALVYHYDVPLRSVTDRRPLRTNKGHVIRTVKSITNSIYANAYAEEILKLYQETFKNITFKFG